MGDRPPPRRARGDARVHLPGRADRGERAIPGYNVMGVAKAALDASMRYLAADLGPKNIRVNAISAGPVRTLAARGIAGFSQMEGVIAERSPLGRGIEADDVGQAGLYL